jgi:ABC-type transport system substrate-binding protein/predicted Ser/Thr protein kinase
MVGTRLNARYRIDAELGRGGMGIVYRAYDDLLGRDVAVKVLNESGLGTQGRARLLREAQAAAKLNHPNIVSIHDVGEADGKLFIVMEFVEGDSLYNRRPTDLGEILAVTRQVCAALEHAHMHGIIHRDLKLENVVITQDQVVKLMDFGLAHTGDLPRLTLEGALIGTLSYLAPELILGQPASAQSDLYALGVMLYEMTTGRPPFTGDNLTVLSQHLYATVVPPSSHNPQIPPALESLILRLLSRRPEERLASAAEVRLALESWRGEAPTSTAELSLLDRLVRGRLVGRDRELGEASLLWRQVVSGGEASRVLLISGEPGIGKTRLMRELVTLAQFSHARALVGECYAEGGAPYAPIVQMIQAAADLSDLENLTGLADLITLAPALRTRFPNVQPRASLDPQAEQQRLFDSVVELCTALSPLLLVIDDAHWADGGTLALLHYIARQSRTLRAKLLIVLTYREMELDEARVLNSMLHDFTRERLATRLKLTRLNREQTRDLLAGMFAEDIAPEFSDRIYLETEGNPFFIEEVCKALIEGGKLYREGGRWRWLSMQDIEIPQSVRVAVQTRVGGLPPSAQETLKLAAIFGREFDFDALKAMSELDEDALIDALEMAERAQIISEARRGQPAKGRAGLSFAFAHALIPSTLQDGISGLRRQRLHLRAAQALERLYPDRLDELAPRLGRHFAEAGEGEKAVEYLLKAGDRARELYAYREAIDAYEPAAALLKEQGAYDRAARTCMKLGLTFHTIFDFQRSRQAYQEGFTLWQQAGKAQSAGPLPSAPHALRINWGEPVTLDPTLASDTTSGGVIDQLFSGLVGLGPEDVLPEVAQTWEMLEGGRRYIFHLREDVCWSDGTPVTAGDFEYAWKRVLNPATGSACANMLYDVKGAMAFHQAQATAEQVGVKSLGDFTLSVELERPTSYFLHVLAYGAAYPLPRHVVEAQGAAWAQLGHIVTNGPFQLESWQTDRSLTLTRNPEYRGQFSGNVQRVELSLLQDRSAHLKLYEADRMDILGGPIPPTEFDRVHHRHAGEYVSAPGPSILYIGLDPTRPPFDDRRVRQALAYAIDRETLAEVAMRGFGSPATGGAVPPGIPGHSAGIGLPYDPDRARQLLAEAGFPGGRGLTPIDASTSRSEWGGPLNEYLQTQWRDKLGVQVAWNVMEWAAFLASIEELPPLVFRMTWLPEYPDPDAFMRVAFRQRYHRWKNAAYDELIEEARQIVAPSERINMYQAADRILVEEAAFIPLMYGRWHMLIKPWVRQFPTLPMRNWFWKDVVIEPH